MLKKFIFFSLSIFILSACASSEKLLQTGHYDNAIEKSIKKLDKSPTDRQETDILRKALKLANKSDEDAIRQLRLSGQPDVWESIYQHYKKLNRRQELISRLPDQVLNKINFIPKDYVTNIAIARRRAANYFDASGKALLRENNRIDARKAWEYFQKEKQLFPSSQGIDKLIYKALQAGKTRVLFEVKDNSQRILPKNFISTFYNLNFNLLNRKWLQFSPRRESQWSYDYVVVLNIQQIDISPELIDRNSHVEKKNIQDGWRYLLDARGNVKKDSTGNDIKVKRYKTIRCEVTNILMTKTAKISGSLEYYNNQSSQLIKSRPIGGLFTFDYRYATVYGNPLALKRGTMDFVRRGPGTFPSDIQMILGAQGVLKSMVTNQLRQDSRLFR